MTRKEMFEFMERQFKANMELAKAKNNDYTGASNDPFFNFRRGGMVGFAVRLDDKVSRLLALSQGVTPQVKDEQIEDTLMDIANYAMLGLAFVKEGKG